MLHFDAKTFLSNLTLQPGVYRMLDATGTTIYVGKAKNLKHRLSSYFRTQQDSFKTERLVSKIAQIEVTVTPSEVEALLLENTLIKQYQPRYNVIFKDDKSYLFIALSKDEYPRLLSGRKNQLKNCELFGPYMTQQCVRSALETLFKTFQLRSCSNHFFKHRERPCLQHQIKRCSAPCVGFVSKESYQTNVSSVRTFLCGKGSDLLDTLNEQMKVYAEALSFEAAAKVRDQLRALQLVEKQQSVDTQHDVDVDAIAVTTQNSVSCVHRLSIRGGKVVDGQSYFPINAKEHDEASVLASFLRQFYTALVREAPRLAPSLIITSIEVSEIEDLKEYLATQVKVLLKSNVRGIRRQWLAMARVNAISALNTKLGRERDQQSQLAALASVFSLPKLPNQVACFDISHLQGEATVGACVVFNAQGPLKKAYRRINLRDITPGDDYAAIAQTLERYLGHQQKKGDFLPDLVLIDGGKGQLSAAVEVLQKLALMDQITLLAVSKGPTRKAGLEQIWRVADKEPKRFSSDDPVLHLIQRIRDEAHRFAITGHRKRRDKRRLTSVLEEIPGVGKARREALLLHFGGWQGLQSATTEDIGQVKGISKNLAGEIFRAIAKRSSARWDESTA